MSSMNKLVKAWDKQADALTFNYHVSVNPNCRIRVWKQRRLVQLNGASKSQVRQRRNHLQRKISRITPRGKAWKRVLNNSLDFWHCWE